MPSSSVQWIKSDFLWPDYQRQSIDSFCLRSRRSAGNWTKYSFLANFLEAVLPKKFILFFERSCRGLLFFSEKKTFSIQLLFPAPFVACHDSTVVEKNNFLAIIKKIFCYKVFFSAKARKSIFDVIKNNKAFVFHRMIRQFFWPHFQPSSLVIKTFRDLGRLIFSVVVFYRLPQNSKCSRRESPSNRPHGRSLRLSPLHNIIINF